VEDLASNSSLQTRIVQPIIVVWPLLVLLVVALAFQLWVIERQSLWFDEIYTLSNVSGFSAYLFEGAGLTEWTATKPGAAWQDLLRSNPDSIPLLNIIVNEGHPPLYLVVLKSWCHVLGTTTTSIRGFSTLCYLGTIVGMWIAGQITGGRRMALLAAFLTSISPTVSYYSTEARPYALFVLTCSISLIGLVMVIRAWSKGKSPKPGLLLWVTGCVLGVYTHYYAAVWMAASFLGLWTAALNLGRSSETRRGLLTA
jgi:uncharacterized membrane protein